jgi:predicted metalloprotease with PDZ domain
VSSQQSSSSSGSKLRSCEEFSLSRIDKSAEEEPLSAKRCRLRKSKRYDGYGLVLKFQQDLHIIDEVEEDSPSYRAGLRKNDVIIFVGKKNIEKLSHDDVKVLIRATALGSDHVELLVLFKLDVPRYKMLQEKGLIDWATMELEK